MIGKAKFQFLPVNTLLLGRYLTENAHKLNNTNLIYVIIPLTGLFISTIMALLKSYFVIHLYIEEHIYYLLSITYNILMSW
jgi:hypothetical protein